jgi:Peptidase C13 family
MHSRLLSGLAMLAACCGSGLAEGSPAEAGLSDWAVGILAADWRDSEGYTIEAFENARRDLTTGFAAAGLNPANITDLSLRPGEWNGETLFSDGAFEAFEAQAEAAQSGCLLYFTSHGSPDGMVLGGEGLLSPPRLDGLIDGWCGERPTVVVISACYSGTFIPALSAPNRIVMTAARADRRSFGCSEDATYPYFDGCVLESLPNAADFIHLSSLARKCVARREKEENLRPASEPQIKVGADVESAYLFLNF